MRVAVVYLLGLTLFLSALCGAWSLLFAAYFAATGQGAHAVAAAAVVLAQAAACVAVYPRWARLSEDV